MTDKPLRRRWRDDLAASGASARTLLAYAGDVDQFVAWLEAALGRGVTPEDLEAADLRIFRRWLSALHAAGAGASTRARKIAAVKNFYRFCARVGALDNAAIAGVSPPKAPRKLPRPVSVRQARAMIDAAAPAHPGDWEKARDQALLMLLYGSGLRIAEALALDLCDWPRGGFLRVTGKGRKERMVPVIAEVMAALERYRRLRPQARSSGPLFLGARGDRLAAGVAQRMVRRLRSDLGLPDTVTPHALRHSFASHLLQAGANLREIQEMLGHASLSSTQRYTDIDQAAMLAAYQSAHPRNTPNPEGDINYVSP